MLSRKRISKQEFQNKNFKTSTSIKNSSWPQFGFYTKYWPRARVIVPKSNFQFLKLSGFLNDRLGSLFPISRLLFYLFMDYLSGSSMRDKCAVFLVLLMLRNFN